MEPALALIADDDPFFRMAISGILSARLGFSNVVEAGSLDEAWEHLGEELGITIALFDLDMPGMQSPANLSAVRELFPQTRVAVVSGSRRRRDVLAALEAGVHGYIPKGLGVDELTDAIRIVLQGTIYVPPFLSDVSTEAEQGLAVDEAELIAAAPASPDVLARLTPRQQDVLRLLVLGLSNKEIMRRLNVGEGTVKIHVAALLRNLGVRNRSAAAAAGSQLLDRR